MNKKKLLVTASTFPRWENDTEPRFILDLCKYMKDMYDITVLVPAAPGAKDREILEGINIIRYHYFPIHKWETLCYPGAIIPRIKEKKLRIFLVPFLFMALWVQLYRLLPNYDVVHAHWVIPQGIIQSLFKKAYVVTGHGGDIASLNQGLIRKLKKRCVNRAGCVTVVSGSLKDDIQKIAPGVEPEVVPMGVDIQKFGKQYYQSNYFNQNGKKVVLFVGRLAEKKGVTYLIDAMKNVDALLVIVGDGPLRNELEAQAAQVNENSGEKKIQFLGRKNHIELKAIYASADIFVVPSVRAKDGDMEGFPLVMVEAMASGLPVVASRLSGIPEAIQDRYNGLLCEEKNVQQLADNIVMLLNDQNLYRTIQKNAMSTAKMYDYSYIAKKYSAIIQRCCQ